MHQKQLITAGKKLQAGNKVLILLHGRGGSAEDILSLSSYLDVKDFSLLAPQATNHTWYPYSFLAPPAENEPWLSSALSVLDQMVEELLAQGIRRDQLYFLGFSQGACLTLEFVTRNAARYGGVIAFTGGLIGDSLYTENYSGDFGGTPIFIGTSDPDPHVPVVRIKETEKILLEKNAALTVKIYPNMGHTINEDEIRMANEVFGS
jgi:phospholipase/carboxylesterase